jgi:toxin ParE1/3/4
MKRASAKLTLSPAARGDIRDILIWSKDKFGVRGAERYRTLLMQVLHDVTEDPERPGSKERPEIMAPKVRTYHFFFSRNRVTGQPVKEPRHFVLYRCRTDGGTEIARILHDSRDLGRHLPEDYKR